MLKLWSGDSKYLKKYGSSGQLRLFCPDPANGKTKRNYLPPEKEKYIYSHSVTSGNDIFFSDMEDIILHPC